MYIQFKKERKKSWSVEHCTLSTITIHNICTVRKKKKKSWSVEQYSVNYHHSQHLHSVAISQCKHTQKNSMLFGILNMFVGPYAHKTTSGYKVSHFTGTKSFFFNG